MWLLVMLAILLSGCGQPVPSVPVPTPRLVVREERALRLEAGGDRSLSWEPRPGLSMLISTAPGAQWGRHPIREVALGEPPWTDRAAPDGVTCYYRLRQGEAVGNEVALEWPDRPLPRVQDPSLVVDKLNYVLEVCDGGRPVKRYPIALGRKPDQRKVCYDNASTPEGRYRIINLQPEATYYRAYDIDYPNDLDRRRHEFFRANGLLEGEPDIGGEIQIHGRGIHANWTFGCMALRNEDMDELFAHPELTVGTPVTILGRELTREDLEAIDRVDRAALEKALGDTSPESLGRFQLKQKLPVTMQPDQRTQAALGL